MSALDYLKDFRVVKISLPLQDGSLQVLDGVAKATTPPQFEVTFLANQLQAQLLKKNESCQINFDLGGEGRSIMARFVDCVDETKLLLEMSESFSYEQKREYFRVEAQLSVSFWLVEDERPAAHFVDTSVNISGGGIRIPVAECIPEGSSIGIEIVFDSPQSTVVECVGEVVGNYAIGNKDYAAVKFVEIGEEERDAVIAYCLAEQRRQLRLKVRVTG